MLTGHVNPLTPDHMNDPLYGLGRRERQIMSILYRLRRASASEVLTELGEPLSNSAVRGMLRLLASKGHVVIEDDGTRYLYSPAEPAENAQRSALEHLITTFFGSSPASAMAALLDINGKSLSDDEYQRLAAMLEQSRRASEDE